MILRCNRGFCFGVCLQLIYLEKLTLNKFIIHKIYIFPLLQKRPKFILVQTGNIQYYSLGNIGIPGPIHQSNQTANMAHLISLRKMNSS